MKIYFHPSVGQKITLSPPLLASHISSYSAIRFIAVVDNSEFDQINRDGGTLQLWSNNPYNDGSEWREHDFTEDTNTSPVQTNGRRLSLCLPVILPPDVDEVELSYTYRISYPVGRVKWLGKYGQNGICVVHRRGSHITLCDRWYNKGDSTFKLDTAGSLKAPLNVLGGLDPNSYYLYAFGSDGSDPSTSFAHSAVDDAGGIISDCSLLFVVPKNAPDSHILPQVFVISSSLGNSISLSATGDIGVNGDAENSLLLQAYDPRTDLRSIVEAAITHSTSRKIRVLSIDRQNSIVALATSTIQYPMHLAAIGLSSETEIQTTEVDHEQLDFKNLHADPVNSICVFPPFKTGTAHISRDCNTKHASLDIGTRYLLSPEYHLRSQKGHWRISVLSVHTNVCVFPEQPDVRMLPTPPASPKVPAKKPSASKQMPSSVTSRAQLAKRIAKAVITSVRYWFTAMFFPVMAIFYIISILRRRPDNAKKDSKSGKDDEKRPHHAVVSEKNAGQGLYYKSLSLRVLPGRLTILLRSGDSIAPEKTTKTLRIRFKGKELDSLVERNVDDAILLTTLVDEEGEVEISAI